MRTPDVDLPHESDAPAEREGSRPAGSAEGAEPDRSTEGAEPDRPTEGPRPGQHAAGAGPEQQAAGAGPEQQAAGPSEDQMTESSPRVVRRRPAHEMTAEERAFLARHRADMPPHHDSAWG